MRGNYYDTLIMYDGSKQEIAGTHLIMNANPRWVSSDVVLIDLFPADWVIPQVKKEVFGITILLRINEVFSIAFQRHVQEDMEDTFTHPKNGAADKRDSRGACMAVAENWEQARRFHQWARANAENGDPDPGPWVSAVFPADCSTLPKP